MGTTIILGSTAALSLSFMPSPFYCTWKKDLVKHVFNFGSMRQNLDAPNQIVSMFEKNTVVVT